MSFSEKFKSFFGKKQENLFLTATKGFLDNHPAVNAPDILPFVIEAGCLLYGKAPTDYSSVFEQLPMNLQENERASFLNELWSIAARKKRADVTVICTLEKNDRIALLEAILEVMPDNVRPIAETQKILCQLADAIGLDESSANEIFARDREKRKNRSIMMVSGAGLLVVLAVILILFLLAIYLKSVFFGFLAAYLALPLEGFFENRFLRSRPVKAINRFSYFCFGRPIQKLKHFFSRKWGAGMPEKPSPHELQRRLLRGSTLRASGLTLVTLLLFVITVIVLASSFILPFIINKGAELRTYIEMEGNETVVAKSEKTSVPGKNTVKGGTETGTVKESVPQKESFNLNKFAQKMLVELKKNIMDTEWVRENLVDKYFLEGGKYVPSIIFKSVSSIGHLLFDIIVFLASFFLFLQKMAFYRIHYGKRFNGQSKNAQEKALEISSWTIKTIFNSNWMPDIDNPTREGAIQIFARIITMFDSWITGYFKIVIIEFCLYLPVFLLFGIPYALPLACISCMTVLLPVIGITTCVVTTTMVTLLCTPVHGLVFALVGVALAYLCINGILEQLILYPSLVGETLGLTALEAIFVVLLGAVVAGIAGMILAVPVAALLKLLIPICYSVLQQHRKQKEKIVET